jgi:hypothetical protein
MVQVVGKNNSDENNNNHHKNKTMPLLLSFLSSLLAIPCFILYATKTVFSNKKYILLAFSIATTFWILFNYIDQLLFFFPIPSFYYPIPADAIHGFVISNVTAPLLGMVISINVYALIHRHSLSAPKSSCAIKRLQAKLPSSSNSKEKEKSSSIPHTDDYPCNKENNSYSKTTISTLFSASSLSVFSSACASCSSFLGAILLPTLGVAGGAAITSFLAAHQTQFRVLSVAILLLSYYAVSKSITLRKQ